MRIRIKGLLTMALGFILACGGGGSSPGPGSPPPTPPTITAQPAGATVGAGAAVSFSVAATGTPPLAYQWRKSGVDVVGATSPVLGFTTTVADEGTRLTVKVSNAGGFVLSNEALLHVTWDQPTNPNQVRVLYLIPQDRSFRQDWSDAIQAACVNLQAWMKDQLGGKTYTLRNGQPEVFQLPQPSAYYVSDTWSKVFKDVQAFAPVATNTPDTIWVLYVDVVHGCNAPGRLGAGTQGLTMLPRGDMEGLAGAPCLIDDCGTQWCAPQTRYVGGLGHELGHALGLSHPPGCDAGSGTCEYNALMWAGYAAYPSTYLRDDDKSILLASRFIR